MEEKRASDKSDNAKLAEIDRLRSVLLEKESELEKLQKDKSAAETTKWELVKSNATEVSVDKILSGFVSTIHSSDVLAEEAKKGPQTRRGSPIHSICLGSKKAPGDNASGPGEQRRGQ